MSSLHHTSLYYVEHFWYYEDGEKQVIFTAEFCGLRPRRYHGTEPISRNGDDGFVFTPPIVLDMHYMHA